MDKEQAKFILQSFRPDGADAAAADFADALRLATEDRELGEWLADERAADAAFAAALAEVEIPEELRQHILAVMRGEKPGDPSIDEAMDDFLISAMGEVQPPAGLRDQILVAMNMESRQGEQGATKGKPSNIVTPSASQASWQGSWFSAWAKVATIAAAVALGALLAFQLTSDDSPDRLFASHEVQQEAGRLLNAGFELDVKGSDPESINTWLINHELPTPSNIPERLRKMKSLGCKEMVLPGDKKASLVCFRQDDGGTLHLIIVKNAYISDRDLPALGEVKKRDCYHCRATNWNVARWQDRENTFILLAKREPSQKDELLRFF
ncbi:MAG: hypothetical protein H7A51_02675 [Akkermansiaceae bacterium]|nr:hypothetical protein [Akkermansiaceae bacterium]